MVRVGLNAERLTRAGAELADEVGFDQVTVSALARRFDVKVASLYSHLKSSQDLKTRIALLALDELAERGAAALAGRAGKDALTAFANVWPAPRRSPGRSRPHRPALRPPASGARRSVPREPCPSSPLA